MQNIKWNEVSELVTQKATNTAWYPRGVDIIPELVRMCIFTADDVSQEFICYWLENQPIELSEEEEIYPLDLLKNKEDIELLKAIKFLMKLTGFQIINKLSRKDSDVKVQYGLEQYVEPVLPHTERRGLTLKHLFYEYGITDARHQKALYKKVQGETLTATERKHLQRFRNNYNGLE